MLEMCCYQLYRHLLLAKRREGVYTPPDGGELVSHMSEAKLYFRARDTERSPIFNALATSAFDASGFFRR